MNEGAMGLAELLILFVVWFMIVVTIAFATLSILRAINNAYIRWRQDRVWKNLYK